MIDNCHDCKTKCCQSGPGPHELVTPQHYLINYGEFENYNKKCSAFMDEKCSLWGSPEMPLECRTFVCTFRSFTKPELSKIAELLGRKA